MSSEHNWSGVLPPLLFAICIWIFGKPGFFIALVILLLIISLSKRSGEDSEDSGSGPIAPGTVRISTVTSAPKLSPAKRRPADYLDLGGNGTARWLFLALSVFPLALILMYAISSKEAGRTSPLAAVPPPAERVDRAALSEAQLNLEQCSTTSPIDHCREFPGRPDIPGKFLKFTVFGTESKQYRFQYESLLLVRVSSKADIRNSELSLQEDNTLDGSMGQNFKRPVIIDGDVDVEFGPIVRHDELLVVIKQNHQSTTSSLIEFGSPPGIRGPPNYEYPKQAVRKVYIIGEIRNIYGPEQRDFSLLHASITELKENPSSRGNRISLGPSKAEYATYRRAAASWFEQARSGGYKVDWTNPPHQDPPNSYADIRDEGIPPSLKPLVPEPTQFRNDHVEPRPAEPVHPY